MARMSYWLICPRGFANEYTVGIATTDEGAEHYSAGFEPISRKQALRELTNRGDNATQVFADVTINGQRVNASRFEVAKELRDGGALPLNYWHVRQG